MKFYSISIPYNVTNCYVSVFKPYSIISMIAAIMPNGQKASASNGSMTPNKKGKASWLQTPPDFNRLVTLNVAGVR